MSAIEELIDLQIIDLDIQREPESKQIDFIKKMREVNKSIAEIKHFNEFDWNRDIGDKLTKDKYDILVGKMKDIRSTTISSLNPESGLNYIDFCMELVETNKINIEYINNLLRNVNVDNYENMKNSLEHIRKLLDTYTIANSDENMQFKKDLIIRFINEMTLRGQSMSVEKIQEINMFIGKSYPISY